MSQFYTITLDAAASGQPGAFNMLAPGSVFHCLTSTGEFRVQADNQGSVTMNSGRGFGSPMPPTYTEQVLNPQWSINSKPYPFGPLKYITITKQNGWQRLTFLNDSASAITLTFYSGFEAFTAEQTVNVDTFTPSVSAQDPSTYTKATTVAVGATTTFNGLDTTKQRKQIIITNPGATAATANSADLTVTDNAGTAAANVPPGQSFTLVTNGVLKVTNPAGNAAVAKVLETFYS
jgi:hypothetical protein